MFKLDTCDFIHSRRRTLGEYRSLLEAQCFQPPRDHHFGPSEWHVDTSAEQYEQKWQTAEQAVLNSLRNKNALVLTREATDNLIACAEAAVQDMEQKLAEGNITDPENIQFYSTLYGALIPIAKKYKISLEQLRATIKKDSGGAGN